jgi:hypothetical protein
LAADLATVTAPDPDPESHVVDPVDAEVVDSVKDQEVVTPVKVKSSSKPPVKTKRRASTGQGSVAELKRIMNDVVQIKELRQHLQMLSHEITGNLAAMLQLASAQGLHLTAWGRAVTLYPNGFLLTEEPDGTVRSQHLNDLDPAQLHQLMQQLIPNVRESLRDAKQTQESLAGDLEAIHDTLSDTL